MSGIVEKIIEYIETLTGEQGERFIVLPWQRKLIESVYGEQDARITALSVPRGNGKSTLLSALSCCYIDPDGPLHRPHRRISVVSATTEQAKEVLQKIRDMLARKYGDIREGTGWYSNMSSGGLRIEHKATRSRVKALSSNPRTMQGWDDSLVIGDEPREWKGRKMWNAMKSGGKQEDFRVIIIGVAPIEHDHFFTGLLRGQGDCNAHWYRSLPPDPETGEEVDDPFSEETWRKANPSYDYMPGLRRTIQAEAAAAKDSEEDLTSFRAYHLNEGRDDVILTMLLEPSLWIKIQADRKRLPAKEGPVYWGVDLGANEAQSAVVMYWPDTGRMECLCAFSALPTLASRSKRDGVGDQYFTGKDIGELIIAGDDVVDYSELFGEALRRCGELPKRIASDRFRPSSMLDALRRNGIPRARWEPRGQGAKDGAEDIRLYQYACKAGRVRVVPSPMLNMAHGGARLEGPDARGNYTLAKGSNAGRSKLTRDDAANAAFQAVAIGVRYYRKHWLKEEVADKATREVISVPEIEVPPPPKKMGYADLPASIWSL